MVIRRLSLYKIVNACYPHHPTGQSLGFKPRIALLHGLFSPSREGKRRAYIYPGTMQENKICMRSMFENIHLVSKPYRAQWTNVQKYNDIEATNHYIMTKSYEGPVLNHRARRPCS
jgi:hypothetical protein